MARTRTRAGWGKTSGAVQAPPPTTTTWTVAPSLAFASGQNQSVNVAASLPASYTAGGTFGVSASGLPLPSNLTISAAGVVSDSGATAGAVSGVVLSYHEPGALSTLTLNTGAVSGTLPYMATVFPAEGAVTSSETVVSPTDLNLRASVLSRWPDNSARVVVVSGEMLLSANSTQTVVLRAGAPAAGSALTAARVGQLITSLAFNFGAVGSATLSNFSSPEVIWWSNERVICARYRQAIGSGGLEAVIDIHAFSSNRAFVEVVIENGKMSSSAPVSPGNKSYTGATVVLNGSTMATLGNPATTNYRGTPLFQSQQHEVFRAQYCSGWVGGDPLVEPTHDALSIQMHPLFFKMARTSNVNFLTQNYSEFAGVTQPYASDVYVPWTWGRQRGAGMGNGGDHDSIGALTKWDTQYQQSGDKYARRASIANALAILTYNINYRDSSTGFVNTIGAVGAKNRNGGSWPENTLEPSFEVAHHPATGLMAFLCRPSPVFIELAQKVALWNGTWVGSGQFNKYFQTRGRAWCSRSLGHAIFLTPTTTNNANVTAWATDAQASLASNITNQLMPFKNDASNLLGITLSGDPGQYIDNSAETVGFQEAMWQSHWVGCETHKLAQSKILSGTAQTELSSFADWALLQPVRYVNESAAGEWRFVRHKTTCGRQNWDANNGVAWGSGVYYGPTTDAFNTWSQAHAWFMVDGPPTVSGPWYVTTDTGLGTYENSYVGSGFSIDTAANASYNYVTHFWSAFCMAVERGVTGADTAWATVNANITNMSTWLDGYRADPRQGCYPRNK